MKRRGFKAQSAAEYALLIGMLVLVIVASILIIGKGISSYFETIHQSGKETPSPQSLKVLEIKNDLLQRIQQYYAQNGSWPGENDQAYVNLGLNPEDYLGSVAGITLLLHDDRLGLVSSEGDVYQVYVSDLKGKEFHLYDGWTIWCLAQDGRCWYQSPENGFEVDMTTLRVVEN